MTTATAPTTADRVELARLTRIEYERRILLAAQRHRLDNTPEDEPLDEEDVWVEHSMALLWAHAWEQLQAKRSEHDWMLWTDTEPGMEA